MLSLQALTPSSPPPAPVIAPVVAPTPTAPILIAPTPIAAPEATPPEAAPPQPPLKTPIKNITITGSTVFTPDQLKQFTTEFENRSLKLAEMRSIADRITQAYLNLGYLTSRAVLIDQTITNGQLQIKAIEGTIERIDIIGTTRLQTYLRKRLRLGIATPLNQRDLEDQLRLLKSDPLFANLEASLKEGTDLGQSILTVRVKEAPPVFGSVAIDNESVPSVGSERVGVTLGYRNPLGKGDQAYASYYRSLTGGANLGDIGYQIPLNPKQGTLSLRYAPSRYRITDPQFRDFDINGTSALYDIVFRQPLQRTPRREFALSGGLTHRTGKTLIGDFLVDSNTTTVLRLGPEWLGRDPKGVTSLRTQVNLGLPWLGAKESFVSWTGQLERLQLLGSNQTLRAQFNWQITPDPLPPAHQFLLGGRQSLRGYRQNLRSADNGISFSLENEITLKRDTAGASIVQVIPFVDLGKVWNDTDNPTPLPREQFLASAGLGLAWKPLQNLNLRLDYGIPLVKTRDRGSNLQDASLYFSASYRF